MQKGRSFGATAFAAAQTFSALLLGVALARNGYSWRPPSFADLLHLAPAALPWLALLLNVGPHLSLRYVQASASCLPELCASPVRPKRGVVAETADPRILALIHCGHYAFVYTPVLTGLLCIAHVETIRARVPGPAELIPLAFFADTWAYHHAIVEHDVKGWQFESDFADKGTVLFRRTLNGLLIGSAVHHTCFAVACLGQPAWGIACAVVAANMYRPSWLDGRCMAFSMPCFLVIVVASLYGSRILYNGSWGAFVVFLLGMGTNPGIERLQQTGDQRWHLLEAWLAFAMMVVQHLVVLRALA